jgi:hypothetical protein
MCQPSIASRLVVPGLLGVLLSLLGAAPAESYELAEQGGTFGRTITYHNGVPQHEWAVAAAVEAWNSSGANVEFVPAPAGQAELELVAGPPVVAGTTTLLHRSGPGPEVNQPLPGDATVQLPGFTGEAASSRQSVVALVATHELGHVLGLGHEDGVCAAMNSSILGEVPARCPQPEIGARRCALLEEDDALGAIALYGGRIQDDRRTPLCDDPSSGFNLPALAPDPPPPAPVDVSISSEPSSSDRITLVWRNASSERIESVVVASAVDRCPTDPEEADARSVDAVPDGRQSLGYPLDLERRCYSLWSRDQSGRLSSDPATARFRPPPVPEATDEFTVTSTPLDFLGPTLRWRNPSVETLRRVLIVRAEGRCPTSPPDKLGSAWALRARPGDVQEHRDLRFYGVGSANYCYALWAKDRFGRLSDAATVSVEPDTFEAVQPGEW